MVCGLALEEYLIIMEFPISVLFGVDSKRYVTKMYLRDPSTTLREVLKKLNDELIKSRIFESYLESGSGFLVFVNDNLVEDIDEAFKKLIEQDNMDVKIMVLPIFDGG